MNFVKRSVFFIVFSFVLFSIAAKIPHRIVSLSPAGSEILCAVGAFSQIVARTDYCDYPKELETVPIIGGFDGKTLSLEKIVSCKPDFVYGSKGMHDYLVSSLNKLDIPIYLSDANSLAAVYAEITYIGSYTGHAVQSEQVVSSIKQTFDFVDKKLVGAKRPTVYYEVWNSPFMSAGSKSFISELIAAAGGDTIFGDIAEEYPMISEETIVARKPQVILIPDMESETVETLSRRNGWQMIPAVQNNRIYFVQSDICSRPGPRITQAVMVLAKAIHPEINFDEK